MKRHPLASLISPGRQVADIVSAGEAAAKAWPQPADWLRTEWPLWALLGQIEQVAEEGSAERRAPSALPPPMAPGARARSTLERSNT